MKKVLILTSLLLLIAVTSTLARKGEVAYQPIYKSLSVTKWPALPGTLNGDISTALNSNSLKAAEKNWSNFLKKYDDGELEDDYEYNHIRLAKFELMRVYYLRSKFEEGDKLITELARP